MRITAFPVLVLVFCIRGVRSTANKTKGSKVHISALISEPSIFKEVFLSENTTILFDRTLLLHEILARRNTFIIAPPGFGKSVNLDMIRQFLEIEEDERGEPNLNIRYAQNFNFFMRNSLKVIKNTTFFYGNFGKYPVVYFDYSELRYVKSYASMLAVLRKILRKAYTRFKFLTDVPYIWHSDGEIDVFSKFIKITYSNKLDKYDIRFGFEYLPEMLYRHFRIKVFILIDEYDTYIKYIKGSNIPEEEEILKFIRGINKDLLLDNEYLDRAVLTGETYDVESLKSSLMYVDIHDVLYDETFGKYYGVTETEQGESLNAIFNDMMREKARKLCNTERLKIERMYDEKRMWSFYKYKEKRKVNKLYGFKPILYCLEMSRNS